MRIKKLELVGFKSFKDRTVIQFDAGITGIVGPNGCGKSNIIDSLLWVMGEQSAKHLRGSSMEDVIFGGAEGYAPAGMAEVNLVLENDGGPFPAKYLSFSEVQVTRRLHRSGESEYLINREPARLRDIQEIFMDTGAGSKGFSIIEQGAIGKIITAKPDDRRTLIEEAAGITKFKVRKRESQKKLESTDQNLIRLNDIVGELKRQIESLQRQAKRAERYRELKKRMEALDLWLASEKYVELKNSLDEANRIFEESQAREIEGRAELQGLEADVQSGSVSLIEKETSLNEKRSALQIVKSEIQRMESELQHLKFEVEQARRQAQVQGQMKGEVEARRSVLEKELNESSTQLVEVEALYQKLSSEYLEKNERFTGVQSRIHECDEDLTLKRRELVTVSQGVTQLEVQSESLETRIQEISEKVDRDSQVLGELMAQKASFEDRRNKLYQSLEKERQMQLDIMSDVGNFESNRKSLQEQIAVKQAEVDEFKDSLNRVASRLYGLENLQANFEGFEEGVKHVMLWSRKKQESLHADGSVSTEFLPVSEVVEVPARYEVAMEAALGTRLQLLLAPQTDRALEAVDYLKESRSGRSSFWADAAGDAAAGDAMSAATMTGAAMTGGSVEGDRSHRPAGEGVLAFLEDVVTAPESHRDTVRRLLGQVAVVDGLRSALNLRPQFPGWTFVTEDGDTLSADGVLTGGASEGAESGLLKRRREIKELTSQKEEWSGKLALAQLALKKLQESLETVTRDLENAQKRKVDKEILMAEIRKDYERAENELQSAGHAINRQERELNQSKEQMSLQQVRLQEISGKLQEFESRKAELEQAVEDLSLELLQARQGIDELRETVTRLQVDSASKKQEMEGLKRQVDLFTRQLGEAVDQLSRMENDATKNSESLTTNQVQLEQTKVSLDRRITEAEDLQRNEAEAKNAYEIEAAQVREKDTRLHEVRRRQNELQSVMNSAQLKSEEARLKETYLAEQMQERYMIQLSEVYQQHLGLETDADAAKVELEDLKDKVKKIGEVNLSAIQEYDEVTQRYEFLSKQQQDLLDAKDNLRKVIDRINRICSKRFKETFDAVNDRFTKVFPVLFGGGEANLILIEDPESGEMGIDIMARPPGKKLQSITLLSGGEKALTAVSLIFSIFLVKPSPFCLLDEVDAPLDDANVARFNDLVREMAKRSQIIVVTHNKHTMEINERLYGVTMQERGVSKMVSVDLAAAREVAGA